MTLRRQVTLVLAVLGVLVLLLALLAGWARIRDQRAAAPVPVGGTAPGTTLPSAVTVASTRPGGPPGNFATLHYVSNTGTDWSSAARLGYNLFDMSPRRSLIDGLAPGQQALVWLGNLDNTSCVPGYTWSEFTAAVDRLADDPKVFGYYISDEPHPRVCPQAVEHIRARADYIHAHNPRQRVFIVILDSPQQCPGDLGCEYRALRPENSHADLIGIDPFPCKVTFPQCQWSRLAEQVDRAVAAGIPRTAMVPVMQAFGQDCPRIQEYYYNLPTQQQMRTMLDLWHQLLGDPVFDFTYTWRSAGPACPGLADANGTGGYADLQSVLRAHNTARP